MDGRGLYLSVIMAFSGLAWLLMLAGVSSLQSQCNEAVAAAGGLSCHSIYRYQWWLVVFDGAVLLGGDPWH